MTRTVWYAEVKLDTAVYLTIYGALVVVTEALSRTLSGIDPFIQQGSFLEVKVERL